MAFFHGPTSYKLNFTEPLGPSLGVNQMWTRRRNDRAPKNECVEFFFRHMREKGSLGKKFKFDNSLVFVVSLSSLPSKHILLPKNK
jgi:hypothetical protein